MPCLTFSDHSFLTGNGDGGSVGISLILKTWKRASRASLKSSMHGLSLTRKTNSFFDRSSTKWKRWTRVRSTMNWRIWKHGTLWARLTLTSLTKYESRNVYSVFNRASLLWVLCIVRAFSPTSVAAGSGALEALSPRAREGSLLSFR